MAFPTIQDADTKNGVVTSNATSWTLTYPTNIAAGDLLVAIVASDGNQSAGTWPAGWVSMNGSGGGAAVTAIVAKKAATGSETGTFSVTFSASEQGAWRIFRIPAATWAGTLGTAFDNSASSGSVCWVNGGGNTTPITGPTLNPNNWDVEQTLWISGIQIDTSRTISQWPYPDRNTSDVSGGAGGATLGLCTQTNETASTGAAAQWAFSTNDDTAVNTIGIRPAAAPAGRAPVGSVHSQAVRRSASWMKRHSGIFVPREKFWLPEGATI